LLTRVLDTIPTGREPAARAAVVREAIRILASGIARFSPLRINNPISTAREKAGTPTGIRGTIGVRRTIVALLSGIHHSIATAGPRAIIPADIGVGIGIPRPVITLLRWLEDAVAAEVTHRADLAGNHRPAERLPMVLRMDTAVIGGIENGSGFRLRLRGQLLE
jgi:hypothetical protein